MSILSCLHIPKISLRWIVPIILVFLIISSLIGANIKQRQSDVEDLPDNRPEYLITPDQIPDEWKFNLEMEVNGKYFLQITTDGPLAFAIETKEFATAEQAENFVNKEKKRLEGTGLLLRFFEDNPRLPLYGADSGFNWEITSPCCISRGVSFSIDNYYIYIFGSQNSEWPQIKHLFTEQATNLFNYLGQEVPPELQQSPDFTLPLIGIAVILVILPTYYYYNKRR